jgi:hypothetical protein
MGRLPQRAPVMVRPVIWRRPHSTLVDTRGVDCRVGEVALVPVEVIGDLAATDYEPGEWVGELPAHLAHVLVDPWPVEAPTEPEPAPPAKPKRSRRKR